MIQVASFGKMEAADVCVLRNVLAGEGLSSPAKMGPALGLVRELVGFWEGNECYPSLGVT